MRYMFSLLLYLLSGLTFLIFGPFLLIVIFIYPKSLYLIVVPFCQLMITIFGCTVKSNKKVPLNEMIQPFLSFELFLQMIYLQYFLGQVSIIVLSSMVEKSGVRASSCQCFLLIFPTVNCLPVPFFS